MWAYDASPVEEVFPLPSDPYFFDVTLRGLARIILALDVYVHQPPRPTIDGGYYTKTRENRPLIGPVGPRGSFVLGALSGYGIMAACGAAELLAAPGSVMVGREIVVEKQRYASWQEHRSATNLFHSKLKTVGVAEMPTRLFKTRLPAQRRLESIREVENYAGELYWSKKSSPLR
ncbi:hypothetical protein [Roseiflexus sp.]|uniref:hypothetical protein n=1 Tax=Roseiflexus sp. TaxID=2562120 RepID=UPI00398B209A